MALENSYFPNTEVVCYKVNLLQCFYVTFWNICTTWVFLSCFENVFFNSTKFKIRLLSDTLYSTTFLKGTKGKRKQLAVYFVPVKKLVVHTPEQ